MRDKTDTTRSAASLDLRYDRVVHQATSLAEVRHVSAIAMFRRTTEYTALVTCCTPARRRPGAPQRAYPQHSVFSPTAFFKYTPRACSQVGMQPNFHVPTEGSQVHACNYYNPNPYMSTLRGYNLSISWVGQGIIQFSGVSVASSCRPPPVESFHRIPHPKKLVTSLTRLSIQ